MNDVVVLKFGGSSLKTPELIKKAAQRVKKYKDSGNKVVVIVSAMGDTTDRLTELAYQTSKNPNKRELDLLVSSGERISMTLMSMALADLGCKAISFTGSQAGVMTSSNHNEAVIKELKPIRVSESLNDGKVVVIAGFQGVDPETKEVTTLGRGGSDISAIAFANFFNATECVFLKDVQGLCSADPNQVENTKHWPQVDLKFLKTTCQWGAKILHPSSIDFAIQSNRNLKIGHSLDENLPMTEATPSQTNKIFSITSYGEVISFQSNHSSNPWLTDIEAVYTNILYFNDGPKQPFYLLTPKSRQAHYKSALQKHQIDHKNIYSLVTLIAPGVDYVDLQKLTAKIPVDIHKEFTTESSFHFILSQNQKKPFLNELHNICLKNL